MAWKERCRGLLAAAHGDFDTSFAAFEHALTPAVEPYRIERGRTLLCLGTVRRQAQQKRAAREALEQALAVFEELGAPLWAERARAELKRISGRSPASEGLTETERRVAELAAHGRTNKQIAAELYMGVSTVESHLSHVYRKLGVRRAGLAGRLADAQGLPAKTGGDAAKPRVSGVSSGDPRALPWAHGLRRRAIPPGLNRSELLRGLLRLEQGSEKPSTARRCATSTRPSCCGTIRSKAGLPAGSPRRRRPRKALRTGSSRLRPAARWSSRDSAPPAVLGPLARLLESQEPAQKIGAGRPGRYRSTT